MKIKNKIIISSIFVAVILLAIYIFVRPEEITILRFGMFTGSNWNVESANSFDIIDKAIEEFEKDQKNVRVEYIGGISKEDYSEWLAGRLLDSNMPDVFMIKSSDFNKFSALNALKDLDTLIQLDNSFDKDKFYSTAYNIGNYQGAQYALPFETVPELLFINKTLLSKEGIEMPPEDWTWEDMYEICNKITKDTDGDDILDQFGTYNYNWINAVYSNGMNLVNSDTGKFEFANDNVQEALIFTKKIHDLNQGQKVTQDDFNIGNVAFMPLTFAEYKTYKTYPYKIKRYSAFQWDCTTFPAGPNGGNISQVDALLIGISDKTKNIRLAWDFLKTLTLDEKVQLNIFKYSQGVSPIKAVTQSKEAEETIKLNMVEGEQVIYTSLIGSVIENGMIAPKIKSYDQVIGLANAEINKILEENKSIDSTLKIFQRNINYDLSLDELE